MEYVKRTYRRHFSQDRWACFVVQYKESDLWIGIDKASWNPDMVIFSKTVHPPTKARNGSLDSKTPGLW